MSLNERVQHFVCVGEQAVGEEEDGGEVGTGRIGQLREEGGERVHMRPA